MGVIVPSILTPTREDLEHKLARLDGLADTVQIDVVDGVYANPATWPYTPPEDDAPELAVSNGLFSFGRFRYEVDLMVGNPEEVVGSWIEAGASRIVVHVESSRYLPRLLEELRRDYGYDKGFTDLLSFGLAISVETDTALLEQYLEHIDFVQFMGIAKIGSQGNPFDTRVIRKIEAFHKAHPDMSVQVDGGVSLATAPALLKAGAAKLVVGSDLWKAEDLRLEMQKLEALSTEHGLYA